MGRTSFTPAELDQLRALIREKQTADSAQQKVLRARMRAIGFKISDFADYPGFTVTDFDSLVQRGVIASDTPRETKTFDRTDAFGALRERVRVEPTPWTVEGSLPVLFFGDLYNATVATVGLNPSQQEYLDTKGALLGGSQQRFATLRSLDASTRAELSEGQCDQALEWMRAHFEPGKPVYKWFNGIGRVLDGFGASHLDGTATHLDLVQEATSPVWSGLGNQAHSELLQRDLPFLAWQIESFQLRSVICTSKSVGEHVRRSLGVRVVEEGTLARIRWWAGSATVAGRDIGFAGWNYPLARPTGLGAAGERRLGELLAERLATIS